jgi:predicted Zn-dependent protease
LYFLTKDYCKAAEAFEHYASMVEEEPSLDDQFLYVLSVYQCEDYEKAKTVLEKLTMEYPDYCDSWQLLGNTYARLKMKKEALDANKKYDACIKK